MSGLPPETTRKIQGIFERYPAIKQAVLYGSRAKGHWRPGSDIDLTLFGEVSPHLLSKIDLDLDNLDLPYGIDLSLYHTIDNQKLKDHIVRVGRVIYRRQRPLPAGWKMVRLGEVCEFAHGLSYDKKDEVSSSKNVVLRANNVDIGKQLINLLELRYISDDIIIPKGKKVVRNSLLVCTASGSKKHLGKVALIDKDYGYAFGAFMGLITPNNLLNSKYLYYTMIDNRYRKFLSALSDGVNINNLRLEVLKEFSIPLPPLAEQKRIAKKLAQIFSALDILQANTQRALEGTRHLFQSILQREFQLRSGWKMVQLGKVCEIQLGKTPTRNNPKLWDKEKRTRNVWLSISDMKHGVTISDSSEYVSDIGAQNIKITPKGTLMVSFKLTLGRTSFAGRDLFTNEAIASLIDLDNTVDKQFLFYYFSFFDWNKVTAGDMKIKGRTLNKEKLKELPIYLPPLAEQKRIAKKLAAIQQQTQQLEAGYRRKLECLKQLRQSVLQREMGFDV